MARSETWQRHDGLGTALIPHDLFMFSFSPAPQTSTINNTLWLVLMGFEDIKFYFESGPFTPPQHHLTPATLPQPKAQP